MSDSHINDRQYDVFLSHNSKDKDAVRKLKLRLEADGLKVWFDERELRSGDELHKAIAEGLDQSRVCAVFIGSEGFGPWHDWEIGIAVNLHVNSPAFRLIPVILPRESKSKFLPSEVPLWLRGLLWVEFPKLNDDEPYQRLKDGILGRGSDFTPRAIRQIEEDTETNITPRGLRSFEEDDKHFFLRLVAGPRDHRGLPVSIAFWKNRLEQVDPDKTFRVGLLFGPSGCGKSSLVKAGLLPRLHQYVKTIYLAATPDRTEQQLLSAVRKHVPELPSDLGLVESLAHLTSQPDVLKDFKLVIVLDQFEQWLHSNWIVADAPLIAALRQCDAAILQAVVMVRADFYVETHRLFEQLNGVTIQNDINAKLIDLFDRDHARNVLLEYGRAYGRFTDPQSLNSDEETFLAETLDQLQDGDLRLVAVQLALFADLMKNKPWTGAVLKKLGGATGVGRAFLEENFDAKTANATQRFHRNAAVAVLKELLPPRGAGIKGTSKTKSELMQAASYQSRPADFDGLLGVLLNDLKLISPVACEEDSSSTESPADDPRYQLSHDYLVPSLRDWLTSKDRESWRGRARLLLEERTAEWLRDSENPRHFPSLIQWFQIQCGVPRRHRRPDSRRLLRKTIGHYAVRTSLAVAVILAPVVAWFGKEFCTFQAEFAGHELPDQPDQRVELIITRKFNPFGFRMGTLVFKDELFDPENKQLNQHLRLNCGLAPNWSPILDLLKPTRRGLAEIEFFDRPVSTSDGISELPDLVGWGHVAPAIPDALVPLIQAKDWRVRSIVADSLLKLGKSVVLVHLLQDKDPQVRSVAVSALGNQKESRTDVINAMVASLKDNDHVVRLNAETALGRLGKKDSRVVEALLPLLKDHETAVRSTALTVFWHLGTSDATVFDGIPPSLKDQQELAGSSEALTSGNLATRHSMFIDHILPLLKEQDKDLRMKTAATLVQLGTRDATVFEVLALLLMDDNKRFQSRAAELLVQLGKKDATIVKTLVGFLTDEDSSIRSSAAASLGKLGHSEAYVIGALVALLKDEESSVRSSAALSLGQISENDANVVEALVPLLKDEESSVRCRAATALVHLGKSDAQIRRVVFQLLDDKYPRVQSEAAMALRYMANTDATVITDLTVLLMFEPTIGSIAAESLLQLGKNNAKAIDALRVAMTNQESEIRIGAAEILIRLGKTDAAVIEALVALAQEKHGDVPSRAAAALGKLGRNDDAVIAALIELLKKQLGKVRLSAASALVQLGRRDPSVIKHLVGLLKDQDRHIRFRAVEALEEVRKCDLSIIQAISTLIRDQDLDVRDVSVKVVGQLAQCLQNEGAFSDNQLLADLTDNDSSVRERAGIVLAYRRQKVDSELAPDEARHLKDIRDQVEGLRKDARPWVKQASLHALYHIEKRKAELEEARRTAKQETARSE